MIGGFWNDETGTTAIGYGVIAAGVSLVSIAIVNGRHEAQYQVQLDQVRPR
jgi:Flp pilus assembly pilin Flp